MARCCPGVGDGYVHLLMAAWLPTKAQMMMMWDVDGDSAGILRPELWGVRKAVDCFQLGGWWCQVCNSVADSPELRVSVLDAPVMFIAFKIDSRVVF